VVNEKTKTTFMKDAFIYSQTPKTFLIFSCFFEYLNPYVLDRKIYHLSTCDTCRKIFSEVDIPGATMVNIREEMVDKETLQWLHKKVGSYEGLFNKRAQKLKDMSPAQKPVKETDFKRLILQDYTFLKRPVVICGDEVWVGNEKATVESLKKAFPKK
jgi:arsenate reductase